MTASVGFKRLGVAVVAMASLGVLVLGLASWLVSVDAARDAVASEVRAVTGLEPTVHGPATLSMFPSPRVSLEDVTLAGFADDDQPFVADTLVANVRWLPLLIGRIEIADVALIRPRITVRIGENGRTNWSPLLASLARTVHPGLQPDPRTLSFSEIRISDGTVVLQDDHRARTEFFDGVEMSLAWPSIARGLGATGRVRWRGQPLDVALAVVDLPAALAGDTSGLKFRVGGNLINLAFEGTLSALPSLKIDGTLAAGAPSLRDAMGWISGKRLSGNTGLGRFALKAKTNLVAGSLALSNLNIELDGNLAEGVLTYALGGRQSLQGTLAVDALDLTPYAPALRLMAANSRNWNGRPIALDWFDDVDFDVRVSAARVLIPQGRLGRTAVAATLRDGRLTVTVGESQAFDGVIKGSLVLAKTADGAKVRSQVAFAGVDLETCLAELIGVRRLEGKGNLSVSLEGAGHSVLGVTRTLDGTVTLDATSGMLVGIDIEQLLRRLERRPLGGGADFRGGRTPFETLGVDLRIHQGNARVEKVRFDGPGVRLGITGHASVPSRELDLTGTAALLTAATETPAPFELPFFVQGTWDDPIMLPDTQALIRRSGAAAPFLDALSEKRTREAVRSAIDRLGHGDGAAALRRFGLPVPDPDADSSGPDSSDAGTPEATNPEATNPEATNPETGTPGADASSAVPSLMETATPEAEPGVTEPSVTQEPAVTEPFGTTTPEAATPAAADTAAQEKTSSAPAAAASDTPAREPAATSKNSAAAPDAERAGARESRAHRSPSGTAGTAPSAAAR